MTPSLPLTGHGSGWRAPLAGLGLAILLGALAYLGTVAWPLLFPRPQFVADAADDCDLRVGPCTATFAGKGFIRLTLRPQDFSPSSALPVTVETGGLAVESVAIESTGRDMNMGLIRHELVGNAGTSTGELVLPVCVRRQMAWQAVVIADGSDGSYRARFEFEVSRH